MSASPIALLANIAIVSTTRVRIRNDLMQAMLLHSRIAGVVLIQYVTKASVS